MDSMTQSNGFALHPIRASMYAREHDNTPVPKGSKINPLLKTSPSQIPLLLSAPLSRWLTTLGLAKLP